MALVLPPISPTGPAPTAATKGALAAGRPAAAGAQSSTMAWESLAGSRTVTPVMSNVGCIVTSAVIHWLLTGAKCLLTAAGHLLQNVPWIAAGVR